MKFSASDLRDIMNGDLGELLKILSTFRNVDATYHGGGLITCKGIAKYDKESYTVEMNTEYLAELTYHLYIDGVNCELQYKEYVFLSNALMKNSEINSMIDNEAKPKTFWQRIFGA